MTCIQQKRTRHKTRRPEHFRCETLPAGFVPRRLLGVIPYAYDLVVDRNLSKPLTTVRYCNNRRWSRWVTITNCCRSAKTSR